MDKLKLTSKEPVKVVDNGEEISLIPSVLDKNLVYYCDDCHLYHLNPSVDMNDVLPYEVQRNGMELPSKSGLQLIIEGYRNLIGEEYVEENNSQGELAQAASCYAMPQRLRLLHDEEGAARRVPEQWPDSWYMSWWKPSPDNRMEELIKAGTLIAMELDRLLNTQENKKFPEKNLQSLRNNQSELLRCITSGIDYVEEDLHNMGDYARDTWHDLKKAERIIKTCTQKKKSDKNGN